MKDVQRHRNFSFVDMNTREHVHDAPERIPEDQHLFLALPMPLRSWIYHDMYQEAVNDNMIGAMSAEALLLGAFKTRCMDCNEKSGLWSPVMLQLPLVPVTLLTGNNIVFLISAIFALACLVISYFTNTYKAYWLNRAITSPFRFVYLVILLANMKVDDIFTIVGFGVPIFACCLDFYLGDWQTLMSARFYCHYEVIKHLPNQVFLCRRHGDLDRKRPRPAVGLRESIIGMADPANHTMALVANIEGLLVELLPLKKSLDSFNFHEVHSVRETDEGSGKFVAPLRFYGLDIFNDEFRCIQDIEYEQANSSKGFKSSSKGFHSRPGINEGKHGNDLVVEAV